MVKKSIFLQCVFPILILSFFLQSGCASKRFSEQYLDKTWVIDQWEGSSKTCPLSFYFTKIDGDIVEGRISIGKVALPECFRYSLDPSTSLGVFEGTVKKGRAVCDFNINDVTTGTITIVPKENHLEVSIQYINKSAAYDQNKDGTYLCRPFTLSDINDSNPEKEYMLSADLGFWGEVNIVAKEIIVEEQTFPEIYLADPQGHVLYGFGNLVPGVEITDISIEDVNMDGLLDVIISAQFIDVDSVKIHTIYCQMEDGLFYDMSI